MYARKFLGIGIAVALVAAFAMAQAPTPDQEKVIKHVPVKHTSPTSGREMFATYCAVCHGANGTGKGPAASALKSAPTDLTGLTAKNSGKFPSMHVSSVLRGEAELPAHGSKDMPVWGSLFRNLSQGHEA